jgi:hypothetical protein
MSNIPNKIPDKMRCSHALFSWHGAKLSTHTRELAFAVAEATMLLGELQRGTMTWTQVVKGHSACMATPFGTGDMGWFQQHEITPEIWVACMVTKVGELAPEPVHSPYGIHIIFRTG